jgi:hypothetical protein
VLRFLRLIAFICKKSDKKHESKKDPRALDTLVKILRAADDRGLVEPGSYHVTEGTAKESILVLQRDVIPTA